VRNVIIQTVLTKGFGIFYGIAVSILTARAFQPEGKADYALITLATSLFVGLCSFGMPAAISYFLARQELTRRRIVWFILGPCVIAIAAFGVTWVAAGNAEMFGLLPSGYGHVVNMLVIVMIAIQMVTQSLYSALMARGLYSLSNVSTLFNQISLIAVSCLIFFTDVNYHRAVLIFLALSTAVNVVTAIILARIVVRSMQSYAPRGEGAGVDRVIRYSGTSAISDFVQLMAYRSDIWIVTYFLTKKEVGNYVLAAGLAQFVWVLPVALNSLIFPGIASGRSSFDQVRNWSAAGFLIVAAGCLVGAPLAPYVVPLLYGPQFSDAAFLFTLLAPGIAFFSLSKSYAGYLAGIGQLNNNLAASVAGFLVGILLNFWLIPQIGAAGAALASTASYMVTTALVLYFVTRATGAGLTSLIFPSNLFAKSGAPS
jgi:O-antigen/teichoic acid export membrane protein